MREVAGVEQDERQRVEQVAGLGQFDRRLHQRGRQQPGFDHAVAAHLEPLAQQLHLGGAPDPVGALDDDDPAANVVGPIGEPMAVVVARPHPAVGAAPRAAGGGGHGR